MRRSAFQVGFALLGTLGSMLTLGCGNDVPNDQTPVAAGEQRIKLSRQDILNMGFADNQNGEIVGGELLLPASDKAEQRSALVTASLPTDGTTAVCRGYYVDLPSVRYAGQIYFGDRMLASSEGWGPRRLDVKVSRSVTSEFSATVGITAGAVSTGVGYTIGSSFGVEASSGIDVPSGRYQRLEGYAKYDKHTFQVWYDGCPVPGPNKYVGDGQAFKPTSGVVFVTRTIR